MDCGIELRPASNTIIVDFLDILAVTMEFVWIQNKGTWKGYMNIPDTLYQFNRDLNKLSKEGRILECSGRKKELLVIVDKNHSEHFFVPSCCISSVWCTTLPLYFGDSNSFSLESSLDFCFGFFIERSIDFSTKGDLESEKKET